MRLPFVLALTISVRVQSGTNMKNSESWEKAYEKLNSRLLGRLSSGQTSPATARYCDRSYGLALLNQCDIHTSAAGLIAWALGPTPRVCPAQPIPDALSRPSR